jgi:hypothetical protein
MADDGETKDILNQDVHCASCGAVVCLRQKIINLALGADEKMDCLACLSRKQSNTPEQVLSTIVPYVLSRQCFAKPWLSQTQCRSCADPVHCLCFS